MNIKKKEHFSVEKNSTKNLIRNYINRPDSRNKKISFKTINFSKKSSTVHTENTLAEVTEGNTTNKTISSKDIKDCLKQSPQDFEDFDICVLQKLCILFDERTKIKTHEEYVAFFKTFKESVQNIFFSRYLEIIKVHPTKNVQFVCSYFFNFLLTILYPTIPEFVDAIQYVAERDFLFDIIPIQIDQDSDYNTNVLYYAFIKIKQAKIQCNIKQHESCNIFIKSTPTIWNIIAQNDQLLKNYFHISEISYIRSHEQIPLWYEVFSDIYNDSVIIWIQSQKTKTSKWVDTLESIEKNLKDLEDKLNILRQRIQILPEWEQRKNTEKEYAKTKQEMENLTIKYSILISK